MNVSEWYKNNKKNVSILGDVMLVDQMLTLAERISDKGARSNLISSLESAGKIVSEKEMEGDE